MLYHIRDRVRRIAQDCATKPENFKNWNTVELVAIQAELVNLFQLYLTVIPDSFSVTLVRESEYLNEIKNQEREHLSDNDDTEWVLYITELATPCPLWRLFQHTLTLAGLATSWVLFTTSPVPLAAVLRLCQSPQEQVLEAIRWMALDGVISRQLLPASF